MAPVLFKDKKGVNFSCTAPVSTAVCVSIDRRSIVEPTSGRAIDRHTPHLRDPRRTRFLSNAFTQAPAKPDSSHKHKAQKSLENPTDVTASPAGSSHYLLNGGNAFSNELPGLESPPPPAALQICKIEEPTAWKPLEQLCRPPKVVVLRVSIHCKGCEGKVRKQLSKMEGVSSFNIDLATKKVTVIGDVTPLEVLNSISKVKNAQFWPSPPRLPPVP